MSTVNNILRHTYQCQKPVILSVSEESPLGLLASKILLSCYPFRVFIDEIILFMQEERMGDRSLLNCVPLSPLGLRFTQDDKHFVDLSYAGDDSKRQNISRMFLVRYT